MIPRSASVAIAAALIIAYVVQRHLQGMAVTIVKIFLPLAALALMTGAAQAQRISCDDLGDGACSGSSDLQGAVGLVVIALLALYWILNNLERVLEAVKEFILIALFSGAFIVVLFGSWYLLGDEYLLAAFLILGVLYVLYLCYDAVRKSIAGQKSKSREQKSNVIENATALLNSRPHHNTVAPKPSHTDPYQQAALELLYGNVDAKLWAKSLAKSGGNDGAARTAYLKYRMAQLSTAADIEAARDKGDV